MVKLPNIKNTEVRGKRVFLRTDLDVPLAQATIEDETRLIAGFPTIQYLLGSGAEVVVGGHLGRPKGVDKSLSLEPVAIWLRQKFEIRNSPARGWSAFGGKFEITQLDGFDGWTITPNLFLLENLRFYEGEEKNDPEFSKHLAQLAEIYVNDAFAMCHRKHASIVGVANLLPHFAGFRLEKEVETLSQVLERPERPLVVVIGGQKIETKLPLISKMKDFADYVLVGGKIAQEARLQKVETENGKLYIADLNEEGTDITTESLEHFISVIKGARTVVWNGPIGKIRSAKSADEIRNFVQEDNEYGTYILAKSISDSNVYTVVGGGDTTEFVKRIGLFDRFDFVSTGGGAMLTFLSGQNLPGLEALRP